MDRKILEKTENVQAKEPNLKRVSFWFSLAFFLVLLTVGLLCFILPQKTFSENENRVLSTFRPSDFSGLGDEHFQEDFESFLTDQFPGRENLVRLSSGLKYATGTRDIGGVYAGRNGRLFLQVTEKDASAGKWEDREAALKAFLDAFPELQTDLILVPPASALYAGDLPAFAYTFDYPARIGQARAYAETKDNLNLIEVESALQNAKEQGQNLYYRTDHHWTFYGARAAYRAYLEQLGRTPAAGDALPVSEDGDFYGTLASKSMLPVDPDRLQYSLLPEGCTATADGKEIAVYHPERLEGKDHYLFFFDGNHAQMELHGKGQGSVLVVKDSFANAFLPFLLSDFETIHVIDLRYFSGSLAEYLSAHPVDRVLILYETGNLLTDLHFTKIAFGLN